MLEIDIYNEFLDDFKKLCDENDFSISYASSIGSSTYLNVDCDAKSANKIEQFKRRTDEEHKVMANLFKRFNKYLKEYDYL